MGTGAAIRGRDIVCVGFNDWDNEVWTNQHHLMARLAADNRVLFVESLGLRRPTLAGRDLSRIARRLRRGVAGPRRVPVGDGAAVHVVSPLVLPLHERRAVRALNARLLPALVGRAARRLGMRRPLLWAYVPQAEALLDALRPHTVVYHCVDDIAVQEGVDFASFRAAEERFAQRADLVIATAPALAARMRALSERVLYAPNVADVDHFATALEDGPVDEALAALPAPRAVFVGAIAARKLDLDLLVELARLRRDWSFALVGPVGLGDPGTDPQALEAEPNVHLLGPRTQQQLPAVLRGADAGLIPYRIGELTASIFPMKVFEYLAAGLGVVATPLPALEDQDGIAFAADAAGFADALDELRADDAPERRRARRALAEGRSWDDRIAEIAEALADAEQRA